MSVKGGAAFFLLKYLKYLYSTLYLLLGLHSFIGPGIYMRTAIAPDLLCDLGQASDSLLASIPSTENGVNKCS